MRNSRTQVWPRRPKPKAKPLTITDRIMALGVGQTLHLANMNDRNVQSVAAIISRNTGRQFTFDDGRFGRVLTRRG